MNRDYQRLKSEEKRSRVIEQIKEEYNRNLTMQDIFEEELENYKIDPDAYDKFKQKGEVLSQNLEEKFKNQSQFKESRNSMIFNYFKTIDCKVDKNNSPLRSRPETHREAPVTNDFKLFCRNKLVTSRNYLNNRTKLQTNPHTYRTILSMTNSKVKGVKNNLHPLTFFNNVCVTIRSQFDRLMSSPVKEQSKYLFMVDKDDVKVW